MEATYAPCAGSNQFASFSKVTGNENRETNFRELTGLEVDWPQVHPNTCASTGETEARHHREEQQDHTTAEKGPLVAREIIHPLHHNERCYKRTDSYQ